LFNFSTFYPQGIEPAGPMLLNLPDRMGLGCLWLNLSWKQTIATPLLLDCLTWKLHMHLSLQLWYRSVVLDLLRRIRNERLMCQIMGIWICPSDLVTHLFKFIWFFCILERRDGGNGGTFTITSDKGPVNINGDNGNDETGRWFRRSKKFWLSVNVFYFLFRTRIGLGSIAIKRPTKQTKAFSGSHDAFEGKANTFQ
jgi:hypothetical protein